MTAHRKGDVVLVPFDFTDRPERKWRPVVFVSSDRYNQETPDLLIASITVNPRAVPHPGDHHVVQWRAAGLLRPSLAQTKLATVEASITGRKLGRLADSDLAALELGLREAFGLA
jgi:mRNA interferase MazF